VSDDTDKPNVVIFPPLLFAISFVVGVVGHFVGYDYWSLAWPFRLCGVAIVFAGLAFAYWGQKVMKAAGTNIRPDMPTTAIVADGPFELTRNPLYLSVIVMFVGIGLVIASPIFLVIIVPLVLVLHFGVVLREERYLEAKFGDAYRAYKSRVRRWV
jgi:protein-S-isoprenylcysteine O-methyltransferase Ste14